MNTQAQDSCKLSPSPLPPAADGGDFAFCYAMAQPHWLAYELPRDYLSSPRAFSLWRITPGAAGWVVLSDLEEPAETQGLQLFQQAPWHFALSCNHRRLEICAEHLESVGTVYRLAGAQAVLAEAMANT